ncbi:TIR domain-containing protein [Bradyrhizobium sp. AUGA SZCCT0274]|uniref:TIR domain-containing protein n=1 Tax=Bradyrhizobium sp. AUGA SZCCT0274 TaxID=2807670 RepID=UPI001BA51915|nr:TIR domain-containing protein [Bradyrhizobium sp. AUGA SZCCT0274]MBR1240084.1 TIR domain-containing protein [Bradyrhizobium sp. AUGA SZCCT0274]
MKKKRKIASRRRTQGTPQAILPPPGATLVRTLRGHTGFIGDIAWSPEGRTLASSSVDGTIAVWDIQTGERLHVLKAEVNSRVAFDPKGGVLASGGHNTTVRLWDVTKGSLIRTLEGHEQYVADVSWSKDGRWLASCSPDTTVRIWDSQSWDQFKLFLLGKDNVALGIAWASDCQRIAAASFNASVWKASTGERIHELPGGGLYSVAWSPDEKSKWLATASANQTVSIWNTTSGSKVLSLEGHTGHVRHVEFSSDGRLLASSDEHTVRLWSCSEWREIAIFTRTDANDVATSPRALAFHPSMPLIAFSDADPDGNEQIDIYELDLAQLLKRPASPTITYTSAKVVLVGDSGVGKTGLGWRLAHGDFKEHASTHGQQFWLLNPLCTQRSDGTQCEAVLWDLAGQDDYRLIHALFLDDTDLALVLFDPGRHDDPLGSVEFWLKQLKVGAERPGEIPTILIAARSDRGTPRLTHDELETFCKQRGIKAYLTTSARTGEGIEELIPRMKSLIPWDDKPATVTTETFKRIKDFVLELKEKPRRRKAILTPEELRQRLLKTDHKWKFSNDEMLTALGHLATHGYVTRLKTSHGEPRILLSPELLNNLAASFVLEARRNRKGLGSLEEERLSHDYKFSELDKLAKAEKEILLDSATVLFLDHNVCFRETDPLHGRAYLVFPELINLKRPIESDVKPVTDGASYTVGGPVENVYASLVVLMGYTQTFSRTSQWQNHARYEVGNGQVCGFRLDAERAGELDFVLYFGTDTGSSVRMLFQGLFESFLARRNLAVRRFESVTCKNGHPLNRAVAREQMLSGTHFAFCGRCGERIALPKADQPIQLTRRQAEAVEADRRAADGRSRFEQVLFRLKTYLTEQKIAAPECFVSYAWGHPDQERWVEKSLASDLQKAGVAVVLDRWENARIGASVPRFVERIGKSNCVIVVGTPLYRKNYDNGEPMRGFVVAAEGDLIGKRMIGTEAQKATVLPVLLEGTEELSFPNLLHGRVYADFRSSDTYFETALELLLSLFGIQPTEPVATDLRETLAGSQLDHN